VQLQAGQREILQALNVANTKISNLPRICAHFTPRERILTVILTPKQLRLQQMAMEGCSGSKALHQRAAAAQ